MRYGIIGTGAIGGYYGARLAQAGNEVHFLLHSDYDHVRQCGLYVRSHLGDFRLDHPLVYNDTQAMPECDVVLVGLKTINNRLLAQLLPPLLRKDTLVVLIQNGIGVEQDVQRMFPDIALAAGLAFICSSKTEPGIVDHQFFGSINIANYSCPDTARVDTFVEELRQAGVEANLLEYHTARWRKAVWNMPFNGMTVALECQTRDLMTHPATRQLIWEQMMEVVHTAQALDVEGVDEAFAEKMMQMTDDMVPYSPSMRLDWDHRRPMEIEYLYSRPLAMARAAGCPMKQLEMLEAELRFMQDRALR